MYHFAEHFPDTYPTQLSVSMLTIHLKEKLLKLGLRGVQMNNRHL